MRYLHAGQLSVTWVIGEMVQDGVDQIPAPEFGSEADQNLVKRDSALKSGRYQRVSRLWRCIVRCSMQF